MIRRSVLAALALALLLGPAAPQSAHAAGATATFEDGADRQLVAVAGARFTTDSGGGWVYGDVRTRRYNAPYPQRCDDRPAPIAAPVCEYAVDGDLFVWTGVLGAEGRIAFTDRQASFVELDLSTGAALTVVAYNSDDKPVATASVGANSGTGRLSTARLDAPSGEAIAALTIAGAANFWLLDNLRTDALPIQREAEPAHITAALSTPSATVAQPGELISYTVVLTNRGRGRALDTRVTLPLDPRLVAVADAQFSRPGAWVSALQPDALEFLSGPLSRGEVLTATIRLLVAPGLSPGTRIESRLRLAWRDGAGGGASSSNASVTTIGVATVPALLAATPPVGPAAQVRTMQSEGFIPGEPVGLWYHTLEGAAVGLGTRVAGQGGGLNFSFDPRALAPGSYQIVAQGVWSGASAVGAVQVE